LPEIPWSSFGWVSVCVRLSSNVAKSVSSSYVCSLSVRRLLVRWPANYIFDRRPRIGVRTTELPYAQRGENVEKKRNLELTLSSVRLGLELTGTTDLGLRLDRTDALDERVDLVGDPVVLLEGVVHAGSDVLVELLVGDVAESQLAVDLLGLGRADDTTGDDDGDVPDALNGRVEPVLLNLVGEEGSAESLGGRVDHGLGDGDRLGKDGTKTKTGEDVLRVN
jgi:hypothetical protein